MGHQNLIQKKKGPDSAEGNALENGGMQSMAPPAVQLRAEPIQRATEGEETAAGAESATADTAPAAPIDISNITLTYGPNANESVVSALAVTVVKECLATAGETSGTISSTARTAEDQARVMYDNLESTSVATQKALYGPNGDAVIDVYVASKAANKSATEIKADMLAKINELGAPNVSKHCADFAVMTVLDVAPSSITNKDAFIAAALADARVTKFLQPPNDPGYHFEIPN